jgi:hypothetical protein
MPLVHDAAQAKTNLIFRDQFSKEIEMNDEDDEESGIQKNEDPHLSEPRRRKCVSTIILAHDNSTVPGNMAAQNSMSAVERVIFLFQLQ